MSLYFDKIFNNGNTNREPSKAIITGPVASGGSFTLCGLLTSEVSLSSQNRWQNLLPSIGQLTTFTQMLGSQDVFSWIGASMQVWAGTDPLKFDIDLLLLNYKKDLNIEANLKSLNKLTAMAPSSGNSWMQATMAKVHGGYMADVFTPNSSLFNNKDYGNSETEALKDQNVLNTFQSWGKEIASIANETRGTASVAIGNKINISNLLVSRVNVTPSLVEIYNQDKSKRLPLYYKVSVAFTGYRPLLTTDIDNMY